jgi:hypothetical protein
MSSVQTLVGVFTEPGRAMDAALERSMLALPLFLLVIGNAALIFWYYQTVDIAWLQDYLLSADPNIDAAGREAARSFMSQGTMTVMGVVSMLVVIPLILLITAVYYLLAAKTIGSEHGFGKWFAFATWTSVPTLLLLPAMALRIMLTANGQLSPHALNPLSLDQLLFQLPVTSAWHGLLNAINLTTIWACVVAVIGLQRWTGRSTATCAFIVLLPPVVIFGGWALFAATRGGA